MTLADVNGFDKERFVEALGWVFEHSPWVAERAWRQRPFATLDHLHATMVAEVAAATVQEQLALLQAHPDLGARVGQTMSDASMREQAGAGLDTLTPEELDRLRQLGSAYRNRFGIPFLFAVKGSAKHDVVKALEARLCASRDQELAEALRQVHRIAKFRLDALLGGTQWSDS